METETFIDTVLECGSAVIAEFTTALTNCAHFFSGDERALASRALVTDVEIPFPRFSLCDARDAEQNRAGWHEAVLAELDELRVKEPESYDRIPTFLMAPTEEIDGRDYQKCFYGILCGGRPYDAAKLADRITTSPPKRSFIGGGITPIEALLVLLSPRTLLMQELVRQHEGVTLELLRGWVQDHYRTHRAVESGASFPPAERHDDEHDGNRCGETRSDLCGARCGA